MKTFEEWRQSDEAWEWPAGKGEPDLDTMLRRAWDSGVIAERERAISVIDDIERANPEFSEPIGAFDSVADFIKYWIKD